MSLRLATGPVSWGVDFADAPGNPSWPQVLDGMVAAGYRGLELGPYGYLPTAPALLREELSHRGLATVGSFVFEPLHEPSRRDQVAQAAQRMSALISAAGGSHLVVIDLVSDVRARSAGRPSRREPLDPSGRTALLEAIRDVALIAEDAGLVAVVHPHAGTFIEAEDEIAEVAEVAPLCLDTGHLAYAGLDPVAIVERFGERLELLHIKDVDADVLARVRREPDLGFWAAISAGVFCPAGAGVVDFAGVGAALERVGYDGWATVEQDRVPGGDPVTDLIASRRTLEELGLCA